MALEERIAALETKAVELETLVRSLEEERHLRATLGEHADTEERHARIERDRNDTRAFGFVLALAMLALLACAVHYQVDVGPSARPHDRGPLPVLDASHPAPAP